MPIQATRTSGDGSTGLMEARLSAPGRYWAVGLGWAIVTGLAAVIYLGGVGGWGRVLVSSLLIAGASLLVGILLGFLFGIPRALQQPDTPPAPPPADDVNGNKPATSSSEEAGAGGGNADRRRVQYAANTNLEQISDWLTKILVGVGLTQLHQIPAMLDKLATYFSTSVGEPGSPQLVLAIILYFLVAGFLFGYLWTRIALGGELARADRALIAEVEELRKTQELQSEADATAIILADQYLTSSDISRVPVERLKSAIRKASLPVQSQIFQVARSLRKDGWRDPAKRASIGRVVPVFEALTEDDNPSHQHFGQLGYALLAKDPPDYSRGEAALTKAIELRGPASQNGYGLYEFNRAVSRIKQDPEFAKGLPSVPVNQKRIQDDIDTARKVIASFPDDETDLTQWIALNPTG